MNGTAILFILIGALFFLIGSSLLIGSYSLSIGEYLISYVFIGIGLSSIFFFTLNFISKKGTTKKVKCYCGCHQMKNAVCGICYRTNCGNLPIRENRP